MPLREHQLTHCAHLSTWLFALVRGWHAGNPVTSAGCNSRFISVAIATSRSIVVGCALRTDVDD